MTYLQLPHTTQLTSRATLFQEDGLKSILSSHSEQESDLEVQRLHDVIRRSLGNFEVCPKRQKLDNNMPMEVDLEVTDTPFRLISWSLPPRRIHLSPDHHSTIRHQRPAEDTLDDGQLRQLRAQEAAVDADCILAYICTSNPKEISTVCTFAPVVTGTNPLQLPSLLVFKLRQSTNFSEPQRDGSKTEQGHVKCCPLIAFIDPSPPGPTKRKRKSRRHTRRDQPPPAFFRPMQEWGGKSAGYAMGWRGSRPADQPKLRRYTRDNMRKGILGSLTR